ncbi:MAG: AsmA-like C-terminal region-containing protein [Bacteroidales bacterium]|jgi:hypothetical protein|nr:AsmA-like C-terminal region-containing protein [Bacteroidales bacterium]
MKTSAKITKLLRISKKILIWFVVVCITLIIASLVLSYVYRDKITYFITQELGSQINGEVQMQKIDISFLHSFPKVSIQLHSLHAKSTLAFNKEQFNHNCDTALYAKRISLVFNAIDFFNQRYIIQHIKLYDARLYYFEDSNGNHNWNFIRQSTDTTTKNYFIDLSKISLYNSELIVHTLPQQLYTRQQAEKLLVTGDFFSDTLRCAIESKLHSKFVELNQNVYARNYPIQLKTSIAVNGKHIAIENLNAELPFLNCKAEAKISNVKSYTHVDANYTVHIPSFKQLQPELPRTIVETIENYAIDGTIKVHGWYKGNVSEKTMPAIEAHIMCEKGAMHIDKEAVKFSFKTIAHSNNAGNLSLYQLNNTQFAVAFKNSTATGTVQLSNFENPTADVQAQTTIAIADIEKYIAGNYSLKGVLKGTIAYNGSLVELAQLTPAFFTKNTLSAQLHAENVAVTAPQNSPFSFSQLNGRLVLQGPTLQIDSLSGNVQNNDFFTQGTAHNLIPYLLFDNQPAKFTGELQLNNINCNPFKDYIKATENTSHSDFSVQIDLAAQALQYDKFQFKNLQTKLIYENHSLQLLNTKCAFLNGTYEGSVQLTFANDASTLCKAEGSIQSMPINEVLASFNNFNQTFLQASQINGTATADFSFVTTLDPNNHIDYSTLQLHSKINVKNGEISNFKPFVEMGKKLKVEEFKNVTFTNIENMLTIQNDTVYIPGMDIKTNAFEIKFAGNHALSSNQFTYFMTLYLKKTLAHMFQKRNKIEDFGEIEHNTDGNIVLPLKLHGTPTKYDIDYDFKTSFSNVKKGMEQQKKEWKTIFGGTHGASNPENSTHISTEKPVQTSKKDDTPISSGFEIEYD